MRADHLLALYPPAWRVRYGDEFLAAAGGRPIGLLTTIDIVSGAIDAWVSADVRRATVASASGSGGRPMVLESLMACDRSHARMTTRDGLIAGGAIIGLTLLFTVAMSAAKAGGWRTTADVLLVLASPGALVLSMPLWMTKGQPWKAQAVLIGGLLSVLTAIGLAAALVNR
jgi:hypothetical protein